MTRRLALQLALAAAMTLLVATAVVVLTGNWLAGIAAGFAVFALALLLVMVERHIRAEVRAAGRKSVAAASAATKEASRATFHAKQSTEQGGRATSRVKETLEKLNTIESVDKTVVARLESLDQGQTKLRSTVTDALAVSKTGSAGAKSKPVVTAAPTDEAFPAANLKSVRTGQAPRSVEPTGKQKYRSYDPIKVSRPLHSVRTFCESSVSI